ncbi:hypothetical protein H5410_050132 [Solanum commersonii]|uniref:Uncharacterized protein n=1 Tax=Solanum commersonii TaxID=4109 RepID=A0A9J5WUL5_SOLCO|nr:hypothetical protein H5410_050132 [Solanum commersonii]
MTEGFRRQNQNIDRLEKEKEKLTQHIHVLQERIKNLQFDINQTIPLSDKQKSSTSHSKMDKTDVHSLKNVERAIVSAKDIASPVQTVASKDLSNSLMTDTLPKNVKNFTSKFQYYSQNRTRDKQED